MQFFFSMCLPLLVALSSAESALRCKKGLEVTSRGMGEIDAPQDQVSFTVKMHKPTYKEAKQVCDQMKTRIQKGDGQVANLTDFTLTFQTIREWNETSKKSEQVGMACIITMRATPTDAATELSDIILDQQDEASIDLNMQFVVSKEGNQAADLLAIKEAVADAVFRAHVQTTAIAKLSQAPQLSLEKLSTMVTSVSLTSTPTRDWGSGWGGYARSAQSIATPGTATIRQSVLTVLCVPIQGRDSKL